MLIWGRVVRITEGRRRDDGGRAEMMVARSNRKPNARQLAVMPDSGLTSSTHIPGSHHPLDRKSARSCELSVRNRQSSRGRG